MEKSLAEQREGSAHKIERIIRSLAICAINVDELNWVVASGAGDHPLGIALAGAPDYPVYLVTEMKRHGDQHRLPPLSKDVAILAFDTEEYTAFMDGVRNDEFELDDETWCPGALSTAHPATSGPTGYMFAVSVDRRLVLPDLDRA